MKNFPFYHQHDSTDCGPACLQMIARYHGKRISLDKLRISCHLTRDGASMLSLSEAAETLGFKTLGVKISFDQMICEMPLPCIAHWNQRHFIVVYAYQRINGKYYILIADPSHGKIRLEQQEFMNSWISRDDGKTEGYCLALETTPAFFALEEEKPSFSSFNFIFSYLRPHRKTLLKLAAGMLAGSLIQLVFPFLTQAIVDQGIRNKDLNFISLILLGQLALFLGLGTVELIRGRILLYLSTTINISLIAGFLVKIMKLPLGFFNSKMIGDLMQRINDHHRIQSFLTVSSLNILFSAVSFLVMGTVLLFYNGLIFIIFLTSSLLYTGWIYLFMRRRRQLDYIRFARLSENQNTLIQMITGMQEIKLNNCEGKKQKEWKNIQEKLYQLSIKSLSLNQYQNAGALVFIRAKDVLITFLSASLVIQGELTLGMMLAIQYILGQLNNPVEQMVNFVREAQDASISMERLEEINKHADEEDVPGEKLRFLPADRSIQISDLSFQYEGPHSPMVLHHLDLHIPEKKVTAIVGSSGSGKTTLVRLLLGFYQPTGGLIRVGNIPFNDISCRFWRSSCGSVMQDGYIFSDSIANNITISDDVADDVRLANALKLSNLQEFIQRMPMGLESKIGQDGNGISEGQKQRILIARAIYRNPDYLFFDEATNALDANNERIIIENMNEFFKGKTVIIVAHRLSTVKNADQIVVLEKGKIVEKGDHESLTRKKGAYYELVKNQLELG